MSTTLSKSIGQRVWIAVRFVLFGCIGFFVTLGGAAVFVSPVLDHDPNNITWFLSLPVALVGVFMMLYGVGEWGRWGYLLVFLSIPVAFLASATGYNVLLPHSGKTLGPFVITGVAAFLTLTVVRAFYARRVRNAQTASLDES